LLNYFMRREQLILWHVGDPRERPAPHTGQQHTLQELRDLTLAAQALMLTNLNLLLTPTWLLSNRSESIPEHIQALPLTALDHTPPKFECWNQLSPGAAPPAPPAPARPSAAPDPRMGDNMEDLDSGEFLSVHPEVPEDGAEEEEAAHAAAVELLDGVFADRMWAVTYPYGFQLRTYMIHAPPAPGMVRFLFSLGCVKGEMTLLPPMSIIFHIDVDDAVKERVMKGEEGVSIPFPLYSPHLAWYKYFYKDPKLCVFAFCDAFCDAFCTLFCCGMA
jgi:hypothetical protein